MSEVSLPCIVEGDSDFSQRPYVERHLEPDAVPAVDPSADDFLEAWEALLNYSPDTHVVGPEKKTAVATILMKTAP